MKNITMYNLLRPGVSFEERIKNLSGPNMYQADSVSDFDKNRRQISAPHYKKFGSMPNLTGASLVYLRDVIIDVKKAEEPDQFLREVVIEDESKAISVNWIDFPAYLRARSQAFSKPPFTELFRLKDLTKPTDSEKFEFITLHYELMKDEKYARFFDNKNKNYTLAHVANECSFDNSFNKIEYNNQIVDHLFLAHFVKHDATCIADIVNEDEVNRRRRLLKFAQQEEKPRILDLIGELSPSYS